MPIIAKLSTLQISCIISFAPHDNTVRKETFVASVVALKWASSHPEHRNGENKIAHWELNINTQWITENVVS